LPIDLSLGLLVLAARLANGFENICNPVCNICIKIYCRISTEITNTSSSSSSHKTKLDETLSLRHIISEQERNDA